MKLEGIPVVRINFSLKELSVSLVNNLENQEGLQIYVKNFTVEFNKFDDDSNETPQSFAMIAKNEEFGIN